jgi:uncharacterized protein involved in high-affinity Fe2+ transport
MRRARVAFLIIMAAAVALLAPTSRADEPEKKAEKAPFREYSIGEEVEREAEHLRIAAVWLPPVTMEGCGCNRAGPFVVHLECDIHATRGNPNGFALGEWVPYMVISYKIEQGGKVVRDGKLDPMVAKDGPHYGATIEMPGVGRYKLTYRLEPPSAGGMGRHCDPVTGVAAWWAPFEVSFDWDYKGVEAEAKVAAKDEKLPGRDFGFTTGGAKAEGLKRWRVRLSATKGAGDTFCLCVGRASDDGTKYTALGEFVISKEESTELWKLVDRCDLWKIDNPPPSLGATESELPYVFTIMDGDKSREVPMVKAQVSNDEKLVALVDKLAALIEKYAKEKPILR